MIRDVAAGVVVFLVALPLCLGVALASGAPPFAGLVAGIVGGIVVGLLSGSHTSVSGPAAGLVAVVAYQIGALGGGADGLRNFALAVMLAGVMQVGLGVARAGFISRFFPTSVIKGLLAAIGIIIILKQIPHLLGRDIDPEGDEEFLQPDGHNTFTEIYYTFTEPHVGAMSIGLLCLAVLIVWDRIKILKKSPVPSPLVVVLLGAGMARLFESWGEPWKLISSVSNDQNRKFLQYVEVPVFQSASEFFATLTLPNVNNLLNPAVWIAAGTVCIVASLETLLNVEAIDKIDPQRRNTPSNRELVAQGIGNFVCGGFGGLPVTSVIVRSSANINAGARTKASSILHGFYLLLCVALVPGWLNSIPLACLAAILIMTGWKLASWKIIRGVYKQGWPMFLPFIVTLLAIIFSDLLKGTIIGLLASSAFILKSNLRKPLRRVREKHIAGEVLHIQLPNQVSFLNRAVLEATLEEVPSGGHVLIDARDTDYIDPDILDLVRSFEKEVAPVRGVSVSLLGFHENYSMEDRILFADYTSREVRDSLTPDAVLSILKDGHERFLRGEQLVTRNLQRQLSATAEGQAPLAAILSCIDSRTPAEIIFDLGLGDIFSVRIAGNVAKAKVLGSLEFACAVAGAKLVLVMGHTRCGAINASIDLCAKHRTAAETTGCDHLDALVVEIQKSLNPASLSDYENWTSEQKEAYSDSVAKANVARIIQTIRQESRILREREQQGTIRILGAIYDVRTGKIEIDV